MKVRKGDTVKVLVGEHAGQTGVVLKVDNETGSVLVQGVNLVWKHMRRSVRNPRGARIEKEAPMPICKVMVVCPNCSKPTRVGFARGKDGRKMRLCRHCKKTFGGASEEKG